MDIVLVFLTLATFVLFVASILLTSNLYRQRREAIALYEGTRLVTSTLDANKVLERLLETCATTLNATAGIVRLLSPDAKRLTYAASYGLSDSYINKGDVNLQESVIDQDAIRGQPVIIEDVQTEQRLMYRNSMLKEKILSGLILPIHGIDGRVLGVLRIYSNRAQHFSQKDFPFLQAMTAQAGIALSNAMQYQILSQKDEAEARFLRIVTHELRSPVGGAQSLIRNLTQGYAGELTRQQLDIVSRIEARLDLLQETITDLLDLAASKERLTTTQSASCLDIVESLKRVCFSLQDQVDTKAILLETNADLLPSLWIQGDPDGLERILTNVIGNAVKYTLYSGCVNASLSWNDTWLILKVSDTGIGIPEDALGHVFDEFFRAKNARELEKHGTGLGLAIVKQIVDSFEGQIELQSVVDEGTTFTIHLPLLSVGGPPPKTPVSRLKTT